MPLSALWVYDFDGDGSLEIAGFNVQGEVFLEDVAGGITQWTYNAKEPYSSYDVNIGHFGGSGEMDLVVGLLNASGSVVLALDGKNGIPMWFNNTDGLMYQVGSADFNGNGIDTALGWDLVSHQIVGFDSYERIIPVMDDAYHAHGIYWEYELDDLYVGGTYVADLNQDGLDEVIMWNNNVTVFLLNGTNGALIWSVEMDGSIKKVEVGNMDGSGWLDIVIATKYANVFVLKGESGQTIGTIARPGSFEPNDFYVRDFSGTYNNDEVAVLWQDASEVFIGWYNHDGSLHYKSTNNISGTVYQMAVGDILGDGYPDVIFGGHNEFAAIYQGSNGQFDHLFDLTPITIYDIIVGNYTGDSKADFVLMDSSYDLHIIDGSTNTQIGFMAFTVKFDEVHAVDIDNDGKDEIVVNAEKWGVEGYDETGSVDWTFMSRLLVSSFDWDLAFADMDADGHTDLIMSNHEYINVVSGATGRLLWHHVGSDRHLKLKVGRFIDPTYPLDILSYRYERLYVVSGNDPTPIPPPGGGGLPLSSFGDMIAMATVAGVPIFMLLMIPVVIVWRRRRRLE